MPHPVHNSDNPTGSQLSISTPLFILICALTMSSVALCIDTIMPALNPIAEDFNLTDPNARQWTISMVFIGMGIGQIPFGIWSDHSGRKIPILSSMVVLVIASIFALFAKSYESLLLARFIQGLAASGPRILVVAIVRDLFSGSNMARMMSLIFMVFIGVPMIAPIIGQWILYIAEWHMIFVFYALFFSVNGYLVWRFLPETLALEKRRPLGFRHVLHSANEVLKQKTTLFHLAATTLLFSSFTAYLLSAQLILQNLYNTGEYFVYIFGAVAFAFGIANFQNAKLVKKYDLRWLNVVCLCAVLIICCVMMLLTMLYDGVVPLWIFVLWAMAIFVPSAMLFSNTNALAMVPLGHVAGMGAAIIGTVSTLISASLGAFIGAHYDGTLYAIVAGFMITNLIALTLLLIERKDFKNNASN